MENILLCILIVSVVPGLCSSIGPVAQRLKRQANACREYEEFSCRAGNCISRYEVCDGVSHCSDGSDETATACRQVSITSCPPSTFQCQYGACISLNLRCNGNQDCKDGSDESGCGTSTQQQQPNTYAPASVCNSADDIQCDNGQCVNQYSLCDGVIDCGDRSDETEAACYRLFQGRCPAEQWRCAYGACLRLSARCDGRQDCWDGSDEASCSFLPSTPTPFKPSTSIPSTTAASREGACMVPKAARNRHFVDLSCNCPVHLGQAVQDGGVVQVTCDPQYQLTTQSPNFIIFCKAGQWSSKIPECAKVCPSLSEPTLDLMCSHGLSSVGCDKAMLPGTTVKFKCKEYYEWSANQLDVTRCEESGQWSRPLPHCTTKCGISNLGYSNTPTITGGTVSLLGNFPWFAGIYHRKGEAWNAACGGTLITPNAVLTAAHCVTRKSNVIALALPESDVRVTLGKYHRDWNVMEESTEIRVTIRKINLHPSYRGAPQQYREDIAVLLLDTEVPISSFVMPACVDYNFRYAYQLTQTTQSGYIAGWGNTNECGSHSAICDSQSGVLLHTQTSVMSFEECYEFTQKLYPSFHSKLTSDKYCAGNGSVSVVQSGDSGGGHTFVFGGAHYVYGVVSTKLKLELPDKPLVYSFAALTNVSFHMEWLKTQLY